MSNAVLEIIHVWVGLLLLMRSCLPNPNGASDSVLHPNTRSDDSGDYAAYSAFLEFRLLALTSEQLRLAASTTGGKIRCSTDSDIALVRNGEALIGIPPNLVDENKVI